MSDVDDLSARDDNDVAGLQFYFELAAVDSFFECVAQNRLCDCLNTPPSRGTLEGASILLIRPCTFG